MRAEDCRLISRRYATGRTCGPLLAAVAWTVAIPASAADPPAAERPVVEVGTVSVRDHGVEKSGRVRTVVPVGDDRSRQFEVRVTLPSPEWLVGTPIEVSLPSAAVRTAVTVPRDALVIRQNHAYVLRLTRTDTVEELDVTPGAGIADVVEVRGPLAEGDRLVIRGGERLAAGQAVRVIDRAHRAPATIHPG